MKFCNQCGTQLDDIVRFCKNCGAMQPILNEVKDVVTDAVAETVAAATETAETAVETTTEAATETVAETAEAVAEAATETVAETVEAAVETATEAATETAAETVETAVETTTEAATETVAEAAEAVAEAATEAVAETAEAAEEVKDAAETVEAAVETATEAATEAVAETAEAAKDAAAENVITETPAANGNLVYCKECGTPLECTMKFCKNCGALLPVLHTANQADANKPITPIMPIMPIMPITPNTPNAVNRVETPVKPVPEKPKKKSGKPLIFGIVAVLLVALGVGAFFLIREMKKTETIDASKLVTVTGYGPNGFGSVAVVLADSKEMSDLLNAPDDANPYPGLWKYLYEMTKERQEQYPDGTISWIKQHTSEYFESSSAWKELKGDKLDEAIDELMDLKISVKDPKNGRYSVGDVVTIVVEADEDDLKDAHLKLTNTTFEYTLKEEDFAECNEINPFEGFEITCEGYENAPKIEYDFKTIDSKIASLFVYSVDAESLRNAKKNGDKVIFNAMNPADTSKGYFTHSDGETTRYYKYDSDKYQLTYVCNGLKEAVEYDLFKNILIVYNGVSPKLSPSIDTSGMDEICRENVSYKIKKKDENADSSYWSIGEEYVITATVYDEDVFTENGYTIDATKQITGTIPSNLPHILGKADDSIEFDPEDVFKYDFEQFVGTDGLPNVRLTEMIVDSIDDFGFEKSVLFLYTQNNEENNVLWSVAKVDVTLKLTTDESTEEHEFFYVYKYENAYTMDCETVVSPKEWRFQTYRTWEEVEAAIEEFANQDGVEMIPLNS